MGEGEIHTVIKELSEMGMRHSGVDGENQDALCYAQNQNFCVISLADGVSTCKEPKSGAEIASRAITNLLFKKGDYFLEFEREQIAEFTISHILFELEQRAENDSKDVEEYSSTVASVLVDKKKKRMLCFNLGDGIIIAAGKGKCRVLAMPADSSSGCCVTTTKSAAAMVSVKLLDTSSVESVVICSDGAWRQMFDKNKLKPEVYDLLANNEYDGLKSFLAKQNCFDDYSFISLDMRQKKRRKSA